MEDGQGIYQIRNLVNGKVYIGSSTNFENRWTRHKYGLNRINHENSRLKNAWNKHSKETKLKMSGENHWLWGRHHSDETKKKMSISQSGENGTGSKLTTKQVLKIREMHSNDGDTLKKLAIIFNVHRDTIGNIISKRTWKHI